MEIFFIVLFFFLVFGFGLTIFILNKKLRELREETKNNQGLVLLQNQLNELSRAVDLKLSETHQTVQQHFGFSTKIIQEVTEKLTKLDETNKQVINFAEQLENLQNLLKNPKQRGVLGEYYLETVLKNVLPPSAYQMQYKFQNGEIVDAVIFLGDQIIPIDAKFSLENYNRLIEESDPSEKKRLEELFRRDLKARIDETAKYIRPEEKTTQYAFMFIPAEAIYYDLLVNQVGAVKVNTRALIEYAHREKHVIIVSPTTFHVYLQLFVEGLRRMQISESVKEIIKRVNELGRHLKAYNEYLQKLGGHLSTTVNAYNTAYNEFKKIDKDVVKISGGESQIEPLQLDKPNLGE
jgi:DNA recombination protein RmuC